MSRTSCAAAVQLYGTGVQALESGDPQAAREALLELQQRSAQDPPAGDNFYNTTSPTDLLVAQTLEKELEGLLALNAGKNRSRQ